MAATLIEVCGGDIIVREKNTRSSGALCIYLSIFLLAVMQVISLLRQRISLLLSNFVTN